MNVNILVHKVPTGKHKITVIPVEAHYSRRTKSNGFCMSTWRKMIQRVKSDPYCFVIFVGDLIDLDRPSQRLRKALMYAEPDRRSALSEEDLDHQAGLRSGIIADLRPIKDKIIGMVDGDHFRQYENGTTSTWYIANQLKIPQTYLGERMGWVRITFRNGSGGKNKDRYIDGCNFDIFVRHGKGSASSFGTDVNALVRQSSGWDADLIVAGHTHRSWFVKMPYLYIGKNDIQQRFVGYARAGSLLRGFIYGETTYPEIAEYNPLSIGWPEVYIHTTRSQRFPGDKCRTLRIQDIKGLT